LKTKKIWNEWPEFPKNSLNLGMPVVGRRWSRPLMSIKLNFKVRNHSIQKRKTEELKLRIETFKLTPNPKFFTNSQIAI